MSSAKRTRHISQNLDTNPHYGYRQSAVGEGANSLPARERLHVSKSLDVKPDYHHHHRHHSHKRQPLDACRSTPGAPNMNPPPRNRHDSTSSGHHQREQFQISETPIVTAADSVSRQSSHQSAENVVTSSKPKRCCTWRCCCRAFIGIFVTVGFAMAVAGIILVIRYRTIIVDRLIVEMQLVSGSKALENFINPPANFVWKFRFFNLTNADEVVTKGTRPQFREVGPYSYRIEERRENVTLNADETDLKYTRRQYYYFDPEQSTDGDDRIFWENETIVTLDFVAFAGLTGAAQRGMGQMADVMFLEPNDRGSPFRSHRVGELLWGADDPLYTTLTGAAAAMGASPKKKPPAMFGLLYGKNGSIIGNYTILTGKGDIQQLQQIKAFNGFEKRYDDVWPTENVNDLYNHPFDANVFRGVTSGAFPPDINKFTKLTAFVSNMCFSMDMKYWTIDSIGDIELLRFGINHPFFYKISGEINRAMCSPEDRDDHDKCAGPGLLNATNCFDHLPVILSWPHFLETDDYYLDLVKGLRPNENRHAPYIDVDPLTGLTLRAAERVQLNFALEAMPYAGYGNLPKFTMFPVVWMEQVGEITPDGFQKLKESVYEKYYALRTLAYSLLIISVILVPIAVIIFFIYQCREKGGRCFRIN